jgi:hypothetical protein
VGNQWRQVNLGERDYEIMGAIEKWGILGLGQLEGLVFKKDVGSEERTRLFFNEAGREIYTKACYKRLSDLEAGGYVRSHFYLNHRKLYTLTESGHEELIIAGKAKLPGFRRSMSEALVNHEIKVNGVGLVLTQLLGFRVATERQLTDWNTKGAQAPKGQESFPDLWIVDKEKPKAIEVELTQKSELRYKEIFHRYSKMVDYGGAVLYLTGWPRGPETLWKIIKKYERIYIHVASIEEFRDRQGRCEFLGYQSWYENDHKRILRLVPEEIPKQTPPAIEQAPAPVAVMSVQEAPPMASLDAPQGPRQWGGGPEVNPYAHLPPPLRPEGWR